MISVLMYKLVQMLSSLPPTPHPALPSVFSNGIIFSKYGYGWMKRIKKH